MGQPPSSQFTRPCAAWVIVTTRAGYFATAQKLSTIITSFPGDLSSTPEGKNWVIKALHPSDPLTTVRGLPDESSGPTVVLSYYNVFRLSCPGQTGTWGFDLTVMPNLLVPLFYRTVNDVGATTGIGNYLNMSFTPPNVASPTYNQVFSQWSALGIEAHRLLAYGVTAYQDGPQLANQGTITAAQWQVAREKYTACHQMVPNLSVTLPVAATRITAYQENDFASYDFSQHLPNAYFAESKDGCYLPMRLTRTSQHWVTDADLEFYANYALPHVNGVLHLPLATAGIGASAPPFPALSCAKVNDIIADPNYGGIWGDRVFAPLNDTWGGISCRNLSYQTSFAFYIRQVVECRVTPTSLLAPQVQMSPPYDPLAIASYFRINRELKDAYPADFNDLGKIWDAIKSAAKVALPIASMLPGPAGIVGKIGSGIMSGIEAINRSASASKAMGNGTGPARRGRDLPPAAAVQRARVRQEVEEAQPTRRGAQQRRRRKTVVKRTRIKLARRK